MHIPVLLPQSLAALSPLPGETYLDCTAGEGGHAAAIAPAIGPGTVILNDSDPTSLELAAARVREANPATTVHTIRGNFAQLPHKLSGVAGVAGGIVGGLKANMLLADIGFSSTHIDDASRGFSFSKDGPLDMRLDPTLPVSAADLVNSLSEPELASIIERFGEDRNARRIASKLVRARQEVPILTTARLAELVRGASPHGGRGAGHIDPATRTFQALRIAVNDEIGVLDALLGAMVREAELLAAGQATTWLHSGARLAVISFHSLEDRPVKRAMERMVELGAADLTDGAAIAEEDEKQANPRARSAKLRAVKLPG